MTSKGIRVIHVVDLLETMVRSRLGGSNLPIPDNIKEEIQRKFYEKWPQLLEAHVVSNTFFEEYVPCLRKRIERSLLIPLGIVTHTMDNGVQVDRGVDSPESSGETNFVNSHDNIVQQLYDLLFVKGIVTEDKVKSLFVLLDEEMKPKTLEKMMDEVGGKPITFVVRISRFDVGRE